MRAAILEKPRHLRVRDDVPEPTPGPGEVVLDVGAAMSCFTDVKTVARGHVSIASYPSPLGHEFAGTVRALGEGVDHVAVGDAVFSGNSGPCMRCRQCKRGRESLCPSLKWVLGGFAEQVLIPREVAAVNLHPVPAALDPALAPMAEPLACVVHAVDVCTVSEGDPVVVIGAGSLGLMLCALASDAGGHVIVLDPHAERLETARAFGAAEVVEATRGPDDISRVQALTDGGAELVIEAVGRPEAWELAVEMAAPGGTVNLFGGCASDSSFTARTFRVHYEEVTLLGTFHHAPRYLARALDILAEAKFPWPTLGGPVIDLADLPAALEGKLHDPRPAKYTVLPRG